MIKRQAPLFIFGLAIIILIFTFGRMFIQVELPNDNTGNEQKNESSHDQTDTERSTLKEDLKSLSFSGDLSIHFNKSEVNFSREPQIFNQEVYVPVSELASSLGFYVKLESDQFLILYKNNTFIELDLESNMALINGKEYTLESGPYYSDQRIYVPLLFLMEAFHYDLAWDKATGKIDLSDGTDSNQFDFIDRDNYFKKVELGELGIRVSIPLHWDLLDETNRVYGYTDDFEYFTMAVSKKKIDEGDTLDAFEDQVEKDLKKQFQNDLQILKIDKITNTTLNSYAIYSDLADGKDTHHLITYLFKENQSGYTLTFRYSSAMDESSVISIAEAAANSFQINQLSIQEREEHYIRFHKYYELGLQFTNSFYANESTNDYFLFEGTVTGGVEGFNVKVSKESQTISFYVPVKNKSFSQKIYLPFGLGRHNIYVETADSGGLFQKKPSNQLFEPVISTDGVNVLQWSMVNVSSNKIRYLIPSSRVTSDLTQMSDLANLLTYNEETSYKKAKAVYHWIEQNIGFEASSEDQEQLRNPSEVFKDSAATEEELAYFYATLIRSLEIPCRIVSGDFEGESHFWNELLINGKWIVADLGEEFSKGDGITTYFNLTREEHYSDYKNIKVLEY